MRGNSIDNILSFFIAWGKTGAQRWWKGAKKDLMWFKSASYIPLANMKLFGYFQSCLSTAKVPNFCWNEIYTVICTISNVCQTPVRRRGQYGGGRRGWGGWDGGRYIAYFLHNVAYFE